MSIHVVDVCIRGPPVVSQTNRIPRFGARCGFGGFGAMTWAGRLDRHASPSFLSSSPAKNRAGGDWPSRKKLRVGAARSRRRGHGPARLDGQASRATVAGSVMKEGKDGWPVNGYRSPGMRRTHAARRAPPLPQARLAGGGPSAPREMSMKNWPIRHRLFGGIPGAPSLRGGVGCKPPPGGQAQRAVFPPHQGRSKKGAKPPRTT